MSPQSVQDLSLEPEIATVAALAARRNWGFDRASDTAFRVSLTAKDGEVYQLEVDCERYPLQPPAFHWRNPTTGVLDQSNTMPAQGGYFHGSGCICAPWNRLASAPGGPHQDWAQVDWRENARTGATRTLAAMVIRLSHELQSANYGGRRA